MADNSEQLSSLKQFLASIATIKGDLSNITAPPFVLAPISTTEIVRFYIGQPHLFIAQAKDSDSSRRMLAVLKNFLASLKSQQYAGREPNQGVKKPLNAFLGEVYLGEVTGEDGSMTKIVSEQVRHHPPVTACYLWNEKHGVRAEGYTRQMISFTGNVHVQQIGYAITHLDAYNEDYLIPLPDVKIKGILTGGPYPELDGKAVIVSSSGYRAVVDFSGKSLLGLSGEKNHVHAVVLAPNDETPLFTVEGIWTEALTFKDADGTVIDTYQVDDAPKSECKTLPIDQQDPWESRRAWNDVIAGIAAGDMKAVADSKSKIETAQRELRKRPGLSEEEWKPLFFTQHQEHAMADKLHQAADKKLDIQSTCGIWRFNLDKATAITRPWRGELTPLG